MFKHPSSTSATVIAFILTFSLTVQSFPVTRSRIVFPVRTNLERTRLDQPVSPEQQTPQRAEAQKGPAPAAGPVINATLQDSGWPAYSAGAEPNPAPASVGDTVTYTAVISNTGTADATGVTFNDVINANTSTLFGVPTLSSVLVGDVYTSIGNVGINSANLTGCPTANTCHSVTDNDSVTGGEALTKFAAAQATLISGGGTVINGTNTVTTTNGGTVLLNTDGTFTYNPATGFSGSDSFFYAVNGATGIATAQVTITVTAPIWFIQAGAPGTRVGTLANPFSDLTGGAGTFSNVNDGAAGHPANNHNIFLYSGNYLGGVTLRDGQKLIGQGASATLASIAGVTPATESNTLPTTSGTNPVVTTVAAATNGINIGVGFSNTLRGFTIGNTTGAKIASGASFSTLTVGDITTPDMTLNGTGQALNLTSGTFAATSKFTSVTTTSSPTSGLTLTSIAGTLDMGSTTVSGNTAECLITNSSTANINYGNTSCTGGANGVSLSGNTAGTRTFGTLSVSGGSGNAFVHSGGGGNVTVNGAANLSTVAPDTIVVQNAANTNLINFAGGATVNKSGAAGNGVQWSGVNTGATLTFATLALTTTNGTGMNLAGGGTVNITTAAGSSISATGIGAQTAPAILANAVALNANLTTTSCNGSGTGGNCISLTTVTGTSNLGGGALTGAAGATFLVSGGTTSVTYSGNITQANNAAAVSVAGGHNGTLNFNTGTISATNGTGLQFDNADGTYNFETTAGSATFGGGDAGVDILNGSGGTFNFGRSASPSSFAITSPTGIAFNVDGTSALVTGNVTYSGNITQANNAATVSVKIHNTGTITFQSGTLSATNGNGLQFDNADGTYNFNGTNSVTSGASAGINIQNGSSGTFSFSTNSSITNPSAIAYREDTSTPTVTYNGTISKNNAANAVAINAKTGGTTNFNGGITATTTTVNAINLTSNTGGTINFNGSTSTNGLSLTTTSGVAFNATGGGTISASQNNTTIVNTLTSTTGTALNVANTTIGASGLTFQKISSNGAPSGVILNNTGSTAGLTIPANGGSCTTAVNCTGGAIQNSTGRGISLTNTQKVSIDRIFVFNTVNSGIGGTQVVDFTLTNSKLDTNGNTTGNDFSNVGFGIDNLTTENNLSGVVVITGNTLTNAWEHGIDIQNFAGTISNATISSNTITSSTSSATSHGSGIRLLGFGNAASTSNITKATISSNTIMNFPGGAGITSQVGNNTSGPAGAWGTVGSAVNRIFIQSNIIQGQSAVNPMNTNAILMTLTGKGQANWLADSNGTVGQPIANIGGTEIGVTVRGVNPTATCDITNNRIVGITNVAAQAIAFAADFLTTATDAPQLSGTIIGNNISGQDGEAIQALATPGSTAHVDVSIKNNTTTAPNCGGCNRFGITAQVGTSSATITGAPSMCLDMSGNTAAGSGVNTGIGIRKKTAAYVFNIEGFVGGGDPTSFLQTANPAGGGVIMISQTTGFGNCATAPIANPDDQMASVSDLTIPPQTAAAIIQPAQIAPAMDSLKGTSVFGFVSFDTPAQPLKNLDLLDVASVASVPILTETHEQTPTDRTSASIPAAKLNHAAKLGSVAPVSHRVTTNAAREPIAYHPLAKRAALADNPISPTSGGTVNQSIGTLSIGSSVTIVFQVTINNAQPLPHTNISNQGKVSGTNFVLVNGVSTANPNTDDPNTPAAADPTLTPLVQPTASNGTVSGTILDNNGNPVEGATVNLSGTQNRKFITDSNGHYIFDNVETNGFYTVTPARVNYLFSPAQRSFSQLGNNTDAAFAATLTSGTALNPLDTPEYFVRQQYLDFLGREPDESGFNFWSDQILGCNNDAACVEGKRSDVSAAFFFSIEFQQTGYLVYRMYQAAYGDMPGAPAPIKLAEFKPDTAEISNGVIVNKTGWEALLESNKQAFATEFVQRNRFTTLYAGLNDAQFIDTLNQNAGFVLTQSERDQLVSDLSSSAKTRAQALRSVAENPALAQREFNQAFVLMQYFGYLRRDANSAPDTDFSGYNFWLNKLNTFGGSYQNAEMVKAFLVASEYRGRFPK
jgi:hypothetical protein